MMSLGGTRFELFGENFVILIHLFFILFFLVYREDSDMKYPMPTIICRNHKLALVFVHPKRRVISILEQC